MVIGATGDNIEPMALQRLGQRLGVLDDVAYVRFASVYRNFREAKDFETALAELSGEDDGKTATPVRK